MRFWSSLVVMGCLCGGNAAASSFVVLEPLEMTAGPSMVAPGEPAAPAAQMPARGEARLAAAQLPLPAPSAAISRSVIAVGEAAEPVSREFAASAAPEPARRTGYRFATPQVIRGGTVGEVFPSAAGRRDAPAEPDDAVSWTASSHDAQHVPGEQPERSRPPDMPSAPSLPPAAPTGRPL